MKAAVCRKYGPPEVIQFEDLPQPIPKSNEVLVKVMASTVNRTDAGFRSAEYFISRFWTGLFKPNNIVLGNEFSGIIEKIGEGVTLFKPGDRVFGFNDKTCGGHGEYLTMAETDAISFLPNNCSFEEAAPITEGAHYALNDIRAAKIQSGQKVLVNGATGAIGSAAVQLLKYFGVHVTAVANTKNIDLVKSLGADKVIDYQQEDFTEIEDQFHFIFDAVGKSSFARCKPLLVPKGIYISTELGKNSENVLYAIITPIAGGKRVLFPIPKITQKDVIFLKELVEQGKFKPVIDRYYTPQQMVEAYRYVESGEKTGNVVIKGWSSL